MTKRYDGPGGFQLDVALDLLREFVLALAVIAKGPVDQKTAMPVATMPQSATSIQKSQFHSPAKVEADSGSN